MHFKQLAVIASLTFLAACGGDSTNPLVQGSGSGSVSFNYSGGGGGSFNAAGAITSAALAAAPFATTWAAGFKDTTDNSTNIAANVAKTGGTSDLAVITVRGQSTGTSNIDSNCTGTRTTTCNDVSFIIGQSGNGAAFSNICTMTAGSITISTLTSINASGSFSGSGTCISSGASAATTAWVVTNGSFNVPLLANVPNTLP